MKKYSLWNNVIGWIVFGIAAFVYLSTIEPTTSFWDCGEYIATSYKLQVGHPPGAPTFQLLARFFTLFTNDVTKVAMCVNVMSALMSAFTILFLFWTITYFSKKILIKDDENYNLYNIIAVLGAGLVGALAFTFTDSFWFNAVEGEVYATSSFFTAITFWAATKWERNADDPHSFKWLIFIIFLIGLAIGVHLLNILAIPAIALIYYYRKYKPTTKKTIIALLIGIAILGLLFLVIIPGVVWFAGKIEIFFVNSLGLPFNSGTIFFFILIIGGIGFAIWYTQKHKMILANSIWLSLAFLLIGYSTFLILPIRSNANTPINENAPKTAPALLAYLNREQYGSTPLLFGPYFNAPYAPRDQWKDRSPVYEKDEESGKYVIIDKRENAVPAYDKQFTTFFPRMWSNQESYHETAYKEWGKIKGVPIRVSSGDESQVIYKPTFIENLRFFFSYQVGFMYMRYFFWNFVGRQNDLQGQGDPMNGNWESGIKFIDKNNVGDTDVYPTYMKTNRARNHYYFLPLILGLIGLFYQLNKNSKNTFIVFMLFFMTGLAIVLYLNQTPYQPRERDYSYVGSTYAYAIWIGLGVLAIADGLKKLLKKENILAPIVATLLSLVLVPAIMAKENWDDHDRSNRYTARDIAKMYLDSCEPNTIFFTTGDNDTFPLWYVQEVEGHRTDLRVCNLSLLQTDWYGDQMKRKVYLSDPLPISMDHKAYRSGTRDIIYVFDQIKEPINLKEYFDLINKDNNAFVINDPQYGRIDYLPGKLFYVPVDKEKVLSLGIIPEKYKDSIVDSVIININRSAITKAQLFLLDIIAHNEWKRPIYFSVTSGQESYMGLEKYLFQEGMTYHLLPIKANAVDGYTGSVNTDAMYNNFMNKFQWGNMNDPRVYLDETNLRLAKNLRGIVSGRLSTYLLYENKKDSAIKVLDKAMLEMPENQVPYDIFILPIIENYLKAGAIDKAKPIMKRTADVAIEYLNYIYSLPDKKHKLLDVEKQQYLFMLQSILRNADQYKLNDITDTYMKQFEHFYQLYSTRG